MKHNPIRHLLQSSGRRRDSKYATRSGVSAVRKSLVGTSSFWAQLGVGGVVPSSGNIGGDRIGGNPPDRIGGNPGGNPLELS